MIRKIIIRVIVFIAVAMGTALLVNKFNNLGLDAVSREVEEPTLPVVYCKLGERTVNMMYGYTQVMSTSLMRDGIIPVNDDYGVNVLVADYSDFGSSYSYELRSISGDSLIENGEAQEGTTINGLTEYKVNFRMDMSENREYVFVFIITNDDGESARYYTRVVNINSQHANEIISFAMDFHNTTFIKNVNESEGNMVFDRLKVTPEGQDYDLSHVNLNSSYDMISWGGMSPMTITGVVPEITELDNEYAVIHLGYVAETVYQDTQHFYYVDEYYTARYNTNRDEVELLAFDRYIDSIFDKEYINPSENSISLGIAKKEDIEFQASADSRKLAFVKAGELWLYDYDDQTLTTVFSFIQGNYTDERAINNNIDINIADMDDNGNMYFVAYGYMNRGKNEGKNGLALYHYVAEDKKLEEIYYTSCDEPFEIMRKEVGRFSYYDEKGYFYYLLDGSIYKVDINDMTQDTMVYNISSDKYLVSDNKKIVAYPDVDTDEEVSKIIVHNFETDMEYEETGNSSDRFSGLGFVGNDLIYGVANQSDINISASGEAIMPLYKICIVKPDGTLVKEYSKSGIYTMNTSVEDDTIYLKRAVKNNKFFEETEPDYISYKKEDNPMIIELITSYSNYDYTKQSIRFPANIYLTANTTPVMTKYKDSEFDKKLIIETSTRENVFYVFDNDGYQGEFRSAGSAITAVNNKKSGLVVDSDGDTIYRMLEAETYNTVADMINERACLDKDDTLMTCAFMCIKTTGSRAEYEDILTCDTWEEAFTEYTHGVGINISGISLDTALYFLDRDIPFAACIDDGRYVLVISYNSSHVRYYDPIAAEEVKVTRTEFSNLLSMQGNTMYTYTSQ
ncbi:MAG: hypothetical protein IJ054_04050 [Lachnospiraceae bacterium]|nr:hypothetical protein [Lachnospiraceae bacterium]